MATPPQNDNMTHSSAPLNFRHTDTLITTKVPHYPTKVTTGMSIIPGWNRPNANGQNANINDKDYNGPDFKARPLKHWRKQLRVYDYNGPANNSRTASISDLERPGTTVYHFTPDCACVPGEGGNSYIISNNKFGYETKNDDYSKDVIDVKIQNNGYVVVPYDATEQQINDPTNPAYKILTGVYNTDCINCSPQGNPIRSGIALQSQAYYSYSNDKLESRCQTFEQNISTNKATGSVYFDAQGIPLWPNDAPNGPQVVAPVNYGSTIYKGNFFNLYEYIYNGVAAGSASNVNSASFTPKVKCNPKYVVAGFYVNAAPAALIEATIYNSSNMVICKSINTQNSYINTNPPFAPSFNSAARLFHFPETTFLEPSNSYYINFKTINSINFNWLNYNSGTTLILAGVLVAEPLYCPSQTIYKPNNIAFAKQGAVSGSARLKKLVSDTVTMNGSSFYSARGAEEANLGRYQGTNISGNYYLKNKPVTNSCLGTIPTAPIVFITENDTYSITFSWREIGNSFCGVEYYTVTYYAVNIIERIRNIEDIAYIDDMKYTQDVQDVQDVQETWDIHATQEFLNINEAVSQTGHHALSKNNSIRDNTIYTDTENNIKFRFASEIQNMNVAPDATSIITSRVISSLNSNTNYVVSMTSTNGNGTSIRSNTVLTNTLIDSNIKIMIDPYNVDYTFSYNNSSPVILKVAVSSLHSSTPIIVSTNESRQNVAEISKVEGLENTYEVVLHNAGTFNLYATQSRGLGEFSNYGTSVTTSPLITVSKDTPEFTTPWNIFPQAALYIGKTYTFNPAKLTSPLLAPDDLNITYTILNKEGNESSIVTFIENNTKILVNSYGGFKIKATTTETQNYKSTFIISADEYSTNMNDPLIEFSPSFVSEFTYGINKTFNIQEILFRFPLERPSDMFVTYSIIEDSADIASIDTITVTIRGAGRFKIRAQTNKTPVYNVASIDSPEIIIHKATPLLSSSWNLFTDIYSTLFVGRTYNFNSLISVLYDIPDEILPISYTISDTSIGNIPNETTPEVIINNAGEFYITATTKESKNYKQSRIPSEINYSISNAPRIIFPNDFITKVTFGSIYELIEAEFIYPKPITNIQGQALLAGSTIIVNTFQYDYFIIGRTLTADIASGSGSGSGSGVGGGSPSNTNISATITNKKIEYNLSDRTTRYVIYIGNDTGISSTITNIVQYISDPPDYYITYSILPTESESETESPVASISGTTVTINKAGTFKIRAQTNQPSTVNGFTLDSEVITVEKDTPVIKLNDLFDFALLVGNTYTFNEAYITYPNNIPIEILPIKYISLNPDIVSIDVKQNDLLNPPQVETSLTVKSRGNFKIRAETTVSANYNVGYVESPEEISTNPGEVRIKFTNQFFGPFTYRDTYSFDIEEVIFVHPRVRPSEIEVKYSIPESYIATVEDRTVTIHSAGIFTIRAETNETGNFITSSSSLIETQVTVLKAVPLLSEPWDLFQTALMVGQTVEFAPPTFNSPPPGQSFPSEISSFIYTSSNELIASIPNETSPVVTINNEGDFYITARTSESLNYESVSINSRTEYSTTLNKPIIVFPDVSEGFSNEITYGDPYFLKEAVFIYPPPNTIVEGTASLNGSVIQLMNLQQYNQIIINAFLTVDTISTPENNTAMFTVTNKYITNSQYFVTVLLVNGLLTNENMTIQNIRQYNYSPSGVSITYSIPQPIPLPNPYIPVATISGKNITINRSGSFQIVGKTTVTEIFTSSDVAYSTNVTVKKATPTIIFASDIFPNDNFLITGKIYSFKPARIELPSSVPHEDIKVNYTSVPDDIVTILDVKDDYVSILINKSGSFQIKAETVETQNFISTSILSSKEVNVNIDAPLIYFPSTFMNELTYGFKNPDFPINTYAPEEALFVYPEPNDIPSNLLISYSIPENQRDIATVTLSLVNKTSVLFGDYTKLAPVITIKNTGKFTLIAETSKTNVFKSVSIRREVEVIRATPVLSTPWDLFTGPLQAGETYNFSPPQFISPSPVPNEIPAFTYMSSNELIASIPNKISPIVKILKQGQFNIIAKTEASENYNEISIRSLSEYSTNINTPAILFPTDFVSKITYGDPYILKEAYFRYPTTAAANTAGLYITHSIEESRVASISISGTTNTVTINGAGTFTIRAETNTTDAFEKTSIYESVTIEQATPILTFASDIFPNNTVLFVSKTYEFIPATITFPPNVIPEDIEIIYTCVPSGVVTITGTAILVNKDASFQINAETVETKNFNKATASSIGERITNFDTPDIYFPQDFTKQVTFGQTYTLAPVIFTHPINPAAVGIFVTYTSTNTNVASISGTTVTIHKWGTFEIRAQTNQIGAFKSVSISKEVEVIRATPEVSTPWNALSLQSISGLTTNTINDWTIIKVGDTLDYILNLTPTSLRVGTTITITYSTTDSVSGRILNIVGNTLTLSITNVSSAVYSRTNVLYQYFHNDLPYSTIYSTKTMLTSVPLRIPFNSFVWDVKLDYTNYYSSQGSTVNATITATSGPTPFPTATTTNVFNSTGYFTNSETRGFTTGKSILFRDPLGTLFSLTYTVVSGNTQNTYGTDPFGGARYSGIVRGYTVPYSTGTITANNNVCFIGDTLTINPPQFISPALPLRSEILPIRYTFASNNVPGIITITQDTPLVPAYVTVNKIGKFRIIANTIRSDRFENPEIISGIEYNTELLSPVITFPPDFTKQITFGQTYTLAPVIFTYPTNPVAAGISVTYTSTDPTVARISGTTVTILKSGTFKISAVTNQTDAFKSVSLTSDTITVNKATPTFPSSWNAFPTLNTSSPIYVGSVLTITAPLIASPLPVPTEILPITYESNPVDAITFAGTVVTLVKAGQFNLIARTKGSDNYNSVSVPASPIIVVNIPPPTIVEQSGTIVWVGEPTITTSPRFVQANPRGTGTEWFAVVDNRSLSEITSYARTNNSSHFTPQGETKPVIFNNIVTTLMTNMSGMFSNALTFNQPISSWDTARVTDMSIMFSGAKAFNQLIGGWNTSSVINMRAMFVDTASFNQEISGWNTTNVVNMSFMFAVTMAFNRPIGSWNTANVSIMEGMFDRANAFNQPIGSWNTAKVDRMGIMFRGAVVFNQPIGSWNTNRVTDMSNMFDSARAFNQPIGSWNTASVTSMNSMFRGAVVFNQPINSWKTGAVTDMSNMFNTASSFNQPISSWYTGAVNTMNGMFRAASSFNQNISFDTYYGYWNTSNVTDMSFMFSGATVFNGAIGWITSKVTNMREMFLNASSFNQYIGRQPINFSTPTELWNTGQVTDMSAMFYNAINFNSYIGNWNTPNLNSFANFRSSSPLSNANTPLRILQGGW